MVVGFISYINMNALRINKFCWMTSKTFIHLAYILRMHCVPGTVLGAGAITANKEILFQRIRCIFYSVAVWCWEHAGETWKWKDGDEKVSVLRWWGRSCERSNCWLFCSENWDIVPSNLELLYHVPFSNFSFCFLVSLLQFCLWPCLSPLSITHACGTYWTSHCGLDICLNCFCPLIFVWYFNAGGWGREEEMIFPFLRLVIID